MKFEPRTGGRRINVVVVAPDLGIMGGHSVQAQRLLDWLSDDPQVEARLLPINPRLPSVLRPLQRIRYVRTVVNTLAYVATLLTRIPKADVAHVFSASYFSFVIAPTPAILVARLFGTPVVLNYHSGEAPDHLRRWRTAAPTLRLADALVVPSPFLEQVFGDFDMTARVIPNSLDVDRFSCRERNAPKPHFLCNRNFEPHYGVDTVLRAFRIVRDRYPDARLTLAGEGPEGDRLRELAVQLGLRGVTFTGRVEPDEMDRLLDDADVFLNGSSVDNMPLSILECFAAGVPVVSTAAGGIPCLVKDGETGLLVPVGDADALAAAALRIIEEPALAARLGATARRECEELYRMEAVGPLWRDMYLELAGAERPRGDLRGEEDGLRDEKVGSR